MESHVVPWSGIGVVGLCAVAAGAWMLSLPPKSVSFEPPPIPTEEADAIVDALKPSRRAGPLVAVVGINDATEATDYLMPYGILHRSGVADVTLLATQPGPVRLFPALRVEPASTIADFDAQHPDGADISASMPMAFTLIEAIASRATAEAVAHDIGLTPRPGSGPSASAHRHTRWTMRSRRLPPATAHRRATSSRCSSSIRSTRSRSDGTTSRFPAPLATCPPRGGPLDSAWL